MTESEWLAFTDPTPMLEFLAGKVSERKLRLFAVACCRRVWHLLIDQRSQTTLEVAESFADGLVNSETADRAWGEAQLAMSERKEIYERSIGWEDMYLERCQRGWDGDALVRATCAVLAAAAHKRHGMAEATAREIQRAIGKDEALYQAVLLRELIGNPFHPSTLDPSWLTSTVTSLAQTIYDERAFDRMPILADALEDVGCTSADILSHCRGPGPHVLGCWVVDLLLGKE